MAPMTPPLAPSPLVTTQHPNLQALKCPATCPDRSVDLETSCVPSQNPSPKVFAEKSPAMAPTQEFQTGADVGRLNRFERLNDTTGRPKRVFRKTPPPEKIRGPSTAEILSTTTPAQDDVFPSARRNSCEVKSLNDTTDHPKRVCHETPPPPRSKDIAALCASTRRFILQRGGMPTDDELAMLGEMRHTAMQMKFEGKQEKLQSPW